MNDDFFALVDTDALKVLSGQPSASAAAMLLVDTHGLIRAQTAAAGELLELENGDWPAPCPTRRSRSSRTAHPAAVQAA